MEAWRAHATLILRPHVAEEARAREELRREAELLGALAHPCLVRGFGAALEGPQPLVAAIPASLARSRRRGLVPP